MRLLGVELTRFWSRRAVALTLVAGALLAAVMALSTVYQTRPYTSVELAEAERQAFSLNQQFRQDYQACLDDPGAVLGDDSSADCQLEVADASWFLDRPPLHLADSVDGTGAAVSVLLGGVAVIVGATFAGADWTSGSMSNQLLFEPRRGRVWWAKAAAVLLGVSATAAVVLAGYWATLLVTASVREVAVPGEVVRELVAAGTRGVALAGGAGVGAYALTMLFRSTVGTLALLFGYAAVGEGLAAGLPVDRVSQWTLANNVVAWARGGARIFDDSGCGPGSPGSRCDPYYLLGMTRTGVYLVALLTAAVVVSLVSFRRRDVP